MSNTVEQRKSCSLRDVPKCFIQFFNTKHIGYGFLAHWVERFFRFMQFWPPWAILGNRPDIAKRSVGKTKEQLEDFTLRRGRRVELFILAWLLLEIGAVCTIGIAKSVPNGIVLFFSIAAGIRIIDIIQVSVNMALFDDLRIRDGKHRMASLIRTIVLTAINYGELILCFGIIYATHLSILDHGSDWTDYFSVITQLTIGYGDIAPMEWGKILAAIQGIIGFLFALLILARFVSILPRVETLLGDDK